VVLGFAAAGVGAVGFTISLCTGALIGAVFAAAGVGMVAGVVVEGGRQAGRRTTASDGRSERRALRARVVGAFS
jgi:hypothetical protein